MRFGWYHYENVVEILDSCCQVCKFFQTKVKKILPMYIFYVFCLKTPYNNNFRRQIEYLQRLLVIKNGVQLFRNLIYSIEIRFTHLRVLLAYRMFSIHYCRAELFELFFLFGDAGGFYSEWNETYFYFRLTEVWVCRFCFTVLNLKVDRDNHKTQFCQIDIHFRL